MNATRRKDECVFLALGSNLGSREAQLLRAVAALGRHPAIELLTVSPVYETVAQTLSSDECQPPYLNAAVQIRTSLSPESLLAVCSEIERIEGRDRRTGERWAPRTLDIDILIFGMETRDTDTLTIPHPRMGARCFVLRPLADIAATVAVPEPYSATVGELLNRCPDASDPVRTAYSLDPARLDAPDTDGG